MANRLDRLKEMGPDLIADVVLYPSEAGGRLSPALPGFGCPCIVSKNEPFEGFDARLLLEDKPLYPAQRRRIGFAFLSPVGAKVMRDARRFYLWEGRFIGEATVIDNVDDPQT